MPELTQNERDDLVAEFFAVKKKIREFSSGSKRLPRRKMAEFNATRDEIKANYFSGLPVVTMSGCPFSNVPYRRRFDPWGTDGMWWQDVELTVPIDEPKTPDQFVLLRGSVQMNGKRLLPGFDTTILGPDSPYVVPKILNLPTMVAVVGRIKMKCGYDIYPIAYFAEEQPKANLLMQEWRRKTYGYKDESGNPVWSTPQQPWDFDLMPWIDDQKLAWIDLSAEQPVPEFGRDKVGHLAELAGTEKQQIIRNGKLSLLDPPSGEDSSSPFE